MTSLEASITLEDVFAVVEAKRVPLAPELAGYLTLEIADGSQASGGEVDPRTVYISEEGTVALVRPKKDAPDGDAETSVRAILAKLLDASGSATPALSASARRKQGAGLPALVAELEAALIPVNRSAGRRALARLAREVKRVTLGVGRNASVPPPAQRPGSRPGFVTRESTPDEVMSGPDAPPGPRPSFTDEALTAKRTNDLAERMHLPELVGPGTGKAGERPKPTAPLLGLTPPPRPGQPAPAPPTPPPPAVAPLTPPSPPAVAPPLTPPPARAGAPARTGATLPPPPVRGPGSAPPPVAAPPPPPRAKGPAGAPSAERAKVDKLFGGDEVDSLLSTFEVSSPGDKEVRNDLKAIAGLDPTPPPPNAATLAELTKDIGKHVPKHDPAEGDSVEALLALSDPSGPLAPSRSSSSSSSSRDDARRLAPIAETPPGAVPLADLVDSALAPISPLVPAPGLSPVAPPATRPPTPLPLPPAGGGAGLKRPATPSQKPARPMSASGRRAKADPLSQSSARRTKASGANRNADGSFRQPRAPRTGLAMLILTALVLAAACVAVWMFKPAFFTGKKRPLPAASTSAAAIPAPPRCKVALVVSNAPANAEILLRVGQAPLDVERMPVGTRLEFVATAEGYAPRRAVVKAEAPWDKTPDGKPRIDIPIQLDPTKAKPGAVDAWPAAEPGSQVGGSGAPGTVHVVSNVRGAEVWLLAGAGPEARIEQLRCDGDIDILLAGPPQLRKRLHVGEKEVQAAPPDPQGNRVISVSAK